MTTNHKGRKPLPPGKKKSEMISLKVRPNQFRAYMTLGERHWLRKLLDAEIAQAPVCECGEYHGKFACAKLRMEARK